MKIIKNDKRKGRRERHKMDDRTSKEINKTNIPDTPE